MDKAEKPSYRGKKPDPAEAADVLYRLSKLTYERGKSRLTVYVGEDGGCNLMTTFKDNYWDLGADGDDLVASLKKVLEQAGG